MLVVIFIILFVKRKANFSIEQQKCKGHEKLDRPLVSKIEFKISQRNEKKLPFDSVFSNGVNFKLF